ncbi:unnamed protein product [Dovyalis caffra]|uniref:Uncharacterized protein n=1 Tax=Dovyalis caffra TaxID=77055 RepID=A0AAV1STY3_9ROSI|nr:unnamed protein product [Dovyalis caffra]
MIAGAIYGVPIPAQPMESIAAVAISNSAEFGVPEIMTAGICTGEISLLLGVTVKYFRKVQDFSKSKSGGDRRWLGLDGLVLAIVCACFFIVVKGAGGLAGQYKFGGRSGGCVALLGAAKLVLGLVLGSSLVMVLNQFPVGVLGVLLVLAGIELAMASRDMSTKEEAFVMLICTGVSRLGSSAALGFLCGIAGASAS